MAKNSMEKIKTSYNLTCFEMKAVLVAIVVVALAAVLEHLLSFLVDLRSLLNVSVCLLFTLNNVRHFACLLPACF